MEPNTTTDISRGMDARIGLSISASDLQTLMDAVGSASRANPHMLSWQRMENKLIDVWNAQRGTSSTTTP